MSKFKVGDRVKCVDISSKFNYVMYLTTNKIYTITNIIKFPETYIKINNDKGEGNYYKENRFKKINKMYRRR